MSAAYTYSEARQNLASLLEKAIRDGEVRIIRKDGQIFVIAPEARNGSPLDPDSGSENGQATWGRLSNEGEYDGG